jgi:hypothetical protein
MPLADAGADLVHDGDTVAFKERELEVLRGMRTVGS